MVTRKNLADLGIVMSLMGGGGDVGNIFPGSDAVDMSQGARFIPGEVTLARRRGEPVTFVQPCSNSCCWYWEMPDGSRIYHWERFVFERIARANGHEWEGDFKGDAGPCPECGNKHTSGGVIPKGKIMSDSSRRAPRNTEAASQMASTFEALVIAMSGIDPTTAILAQEAAGQRSFVNSDTLPSRRNDYGNTSSQAVLEASGVTFGELVKGDPMFQYVELPAGWKREGSSHDMWSYLLDEKGRRRASIFYKAAFYDRSAFYSATARFSAAVDYEREEAEGIFVGLVLDGETVIHTTDPIEGENLPSYELSSKAQAAAAAWLDEHYPDWGLASAYWE